MLIVKDERPKPTATDLTKMTDRERAELFGTMASYGGTYTFDRKTVTHHVDISWNQAWTGTDLVRSVQFDGPEVAPENGSAAERHRWNDEHLRPDVGKGGMT